MAKPVENGFIAQVSYIGSLHGQTTITTWHYIFIQATPVLVDGDAVATQMSARILANIYGNYVAAMPVEWQAVQIDIQWISPVRYRKTVFPRGEIGAGGSTDFTNTSVALTVQGEDATRRAQATKHLPGVGPADVTAGVLNPAYYTLIDAVAASYMNPLVFALGQANPVIYGRPRPADPTATPPDPGQLELVTEVITYNINPRSRVQRRRTVGLGI